MPRREKSSRSSSGSPKASKHPQDVPKRQQSTTASTSKQKPFTPSPNLPSPKYPATSVRKPVSRFREMAEIAAAATVGSTVGHVVGHSIVGVFRSLFGSSQPPQNGSNNEKKECQFEMSKFLECYNKYKADEDKLTNCDSLFDHLRECQEYYRRLN